MPPDAGTRQKQPRPPEKEHNIVKVLHFIMAAGLIGLVGGCATRTVSLAPVGPKPALPQSLSPQGSLIVFSRLQGQDDDLDQEGTEPIRSHHTDYKVYDLQGRVVKRVWNAAGKYETSPRVVNLSPGRYIVKAQAADYSKVTVPVTIEGRASTEVHLDSQWALPNYADKGQVVMMPDGQPVGWRKE